MPPFRVPSPVPSTPTSVRDPRFVGFVLLLLAYTALLFYAGSTGDPLAELLLDLTFVTVVFVFGASLLRQADGDAVLLIAGGALVLSGVAQLAVLAVSSPIVRLSSDALLILGVGAYFYDEFIR